MSESAATEVDLNYEAFVNLLPGLLSRYAGRYALMHDRQIVDYFDSSLEATLSGIRRFGDRGYSVQEVSAQPEHLGFYSYVGGAGPY